MWIIRVCWKHGPPKWSLEGTASNKNSSGNYLANMYYMPGICRGVFHSLFHLNCTAGLWSGFIFISHMRTLRLREILELTNVIVLGRFQVKTFREQTCILYLPNSRLSLQRKAEEKGSLPSWILPRRGFSDFEALEPILVCPQMCCKELFF